MLQFYLTRICLTWENVLSVLPLIFGVFIYSKIKEKFSNYIYHSLFCTALSPIITQTAFVFGWHPVLVIAFGIIVGILICPAATHPSFHKGYNLYNMIAAGITGFAIKFYCIGYDVENKSIWGTEFNKTLIPLILVLFISMVVLGLIFSKTKKLPKGNTRILRYTYNRL